ncbi:MAG: hypothetical protein IKI41_01260 [Clostridia bacterium]|nr:hypothetical protein [Clostridia bacterium]
MKNVASGMRGRVKLSPMRFISANLINTRFTFRPSSRETDHGSNSRSFESSISSSLSMRRCAAKALA